MQQTTNYGFKKPEYTDALDINVINSVMDDIDTSMFNLAESIAVVQETNTATKDIASGTYVFWNNGLHIASEDINEGDTLSVSNLTAVTGGGLNTGFNMNKWVSGYVQIDVEVAAGSTFSTNLKTAIDAYLSEHNGVFGYISGWEPADNHYDVILQKLAYVDSSSSFRAKNLASKKRYESFYILFVYGLKG